MQAAENVPSAAAVIVAAGLGVRFGAPDKVFLPLAGRPLLAHVLDAVERAASIHDVVLVVGAHTRAAAEDLVAAGPWTKVAAIVTGGRRRQDSVAAGVAAVPRETGIVVIHDGARPLAPAALFDRCVAVAAESGAAIAAVPVTDTLKHVAGDRIVGTLPRADLWAAQTPQAFRRDLLVQALASATARSGTFTDEAGLFEALGLPVAIAEGATSNLKVTRPTDLAVAEALLSRQPSALSPQPPIHGTQDAGLRTQPPLRTGIGYDVHRFAPGRRLVLGGVAIPHPLGLEGHSDADVLLHAIADALLGAAALGDIGHHFPPSDPRFRGVDSRALLAEVGQMLNAAGYRPLNIDATVIAEAPRIGAHVAAMRTAIAGCLGLDGGAVDVKATTNEGMGFVGRGEGIAALAVATLGRLAAD